MFFLNQEENRLITMTVAKVKQLLKTRSLNEQELVTKIKHRVLYPACQHKKKMLAFKAFTKRKMGKS